MAVGLALKAVVISAWVKVLRILAKETGQADRNKYHPKTLGLADLTR
jgi:hypothetical protein